MASNVIPIRQPTERNLALCRVGRQSEIARFARNDNQFQSNVVVSRQPLEGSKTNPEALFSVASVSSVVYSVHAG